MYVIIATFTRFDSWLRPYFGAMQQDNQDSALVLVNIAERDPDHL